MGSASINLFHRCESVDELLNPAIMILPLMQRIKYYPLLCQNRADPWFCSDEFYICLFTPEYYPHCFEFDHRTRYAFVQIAILAVNVSSIRQRFWHNIRRYSTLSTCFQPSICSTMNFSANKCVDRHARICIGYYQWNLFLFGFYDKKLQSSWLWIVYLGIIIYISFYHSYFHIKSLVSYSISNGYYYQPYWSSVRLYISRSIVQDLPVYSHLAQCMCSYRKSNCSVQRNKV